MSYTKEYQDYLNDAKRWFEGLQNLLANHRNEHLSSRMKEFSLLLDSTGDSMTEEKMFDLQHQMEELYSKSMQIVTEQRAEGNKDMRKVGIGQHTLPPLPYDYDALEPYISSEIMKLHHDKHHKSYVDGLNKAEKMMQKARETGDFELIKHWSREAAFHGSGHYLHTIFWYVMKPKGGGMPGRNLLRQINNDFGSFELFKKHFSEAANKVEGVGWALLVWAPRSGRLEILQTEKHQLMTQWDTIPLLVLDVWEHAYYLQYKNVREDYVKNWWNIVNWNEVEKRFQEASKVKWRQF